MSSGSYGSYDYVSGIISDFAIKIKPTTPLQKAFKAHLRNVANACYDIEWKTQDKGDEAIRACLGQNVPALVLAEVMAEAKRILEELKAAIDAVNGETKGETR